MDDLIRRGLAAYYRSSTATRQPRAELSRVDTLHGREYVVLKDDDGVVAVFRRSVRGELRFMRRPPRLMLD